MKEMGFNLFTLNPSPSSSKSFDDNLAKILETICPPMKLGNDNECFVHLEETFYVIDAPSSYIVVM